MPPRSRIDASSARLKSSSDAPVARALSKAQLHLLPPTRATGLFASGNIYATQQAETVLERPVPDGIHPFASGTCSASPKKSRASAET